MKFLKHFEEINPRDIFFIESNFDQYFTVAFEFEIETLDESGYDYDFTEIDDELIEESHDEVKRELSIKSNADKRFLRTLCDELIFLYEQGDLDESTFELVFSNSDSKFAEISQHFRMVLLSQIIANDFNYLREKAIEYLPTFVNKWQDEIEFVQDVTLNRGIEIKPKTYVVGITKSIEMIDDFYSALKSQKYWMFASTTGLHINIGTTQKVDWNPIKGLLLMNDYSKDNTKVPLVFKDMTWRQNSQFCGSILQSIYRMTDSQKKDLKNLIKFDNIDQSEKKLNSFITKRVIEEGFKNFGFNITRLSLDYIEFRYAGGNLSKEVLIDKLKYFCFLVYCMTNRDYKRKEYLGKLYKFSSNL